ncbi:ABC-type dipeptide/oligopeptide/nickel transport system, permease component [Halobacteroides halobius DSM 5150]|uniref:Nickel import system permease protein NikB n=1 Tax=Halobacteroides halobius (strain ATCC 35273 / DSM 5150 / MD-1) TaxID=748449 RepID=L0K7V0_HALHC|nr:nickel ABC transporter permease [Halobacteroides halobius]AGB40429.1 ABC-type dipeptide/oligopeptide/nickel transport system, permease component [Halobacteroides halobius DSM 5150]
MLTYIARKSLMAIPILLGIATITFLLNFVFVPGDPVRIAMGQSADPETLKMIREEMGLNDPLYVQYFRFIGRLVQGDLGESFTSQRPVINIILERLPATAQLAGSAMLVAIIIGVTAGVISAVMPNSIWDYLFMTLAMIGVSMPVYWLGLVLILIFSLNLDLLPVSGYGSWQHLILPAIALGSRQAAKIARMTRSSMLEVIGKDYIKTARAKGVAERIVVIKHGLRNALIPVVTVIGTQMGYLLGGTVLTETTFSWPGLGRLAVDAVMKRDFPLIQGTVVFLASVFIIVNLLVDISYGFLDPRINYD